MINKALGIITFASDAASFGMMGNFRSVGSFSFLGRYRIIDFPLSNMSNSGLTDIHVHIRKLPRSLVNHLGEGRQYNINSKKGGIYVYFGEKQYPNELFNTDVASYFDNLQEIIDSKYQHIIISPGNIISKLNFKEILDEHVESGNDITIAYKFCDDAKNQYINCDTLALSKEKQVTQIGRNHGIYKTRNISLETYVLSKELFVRLVKEARKTSTLYWFKDIINEKMNELNIKGYAYKGPAYIVNSFKSYYQANIDLIQREKALELFKNDWQIYTRTNDSIPAIYRKTAEVSHSLISNGSEIKGTVKNSVIGRGCIVEEGAIVENTILLPGCHIGKDVTLNYAVVDKKVVIDKVKNVVGSKEEIIYIERGSKL